MKKFHTITFRITLWYTAFMLVLISIILISLLSLSFKLATENLRNEMIAQVSQAAEKFTIKNIITNFEHEEFKNVTIYNQNGEYIVGEYIYDITGVEFENEKFRKETIDGKDYMIYDFYKTVGRPGGNDGFWIRGVESVGPLTLFNRSIFLITLVFSPLILLLAAFGGYYITRKAFSPIKAIIKTANDISLANDISKRIPVNPNVPDDELQHLSITLNKMLDKIQQLIMREKQFTSDASHELRTPLSVILAQGEYLLELASNEKEKELAANIVEKSKQTTELLSKLLLLARIDSKRQKLIKEKVDVSELLSVAAEEMQQLAKNKNISISINIHYNILLFADEALLLSALKNLINNAIKYGRDYGTVNLDTNKAKNGIAITVADDGIGISKEHIEKVWERFYRVDGVRNDEYNSNGLGLAMVRSIIELHGGTIKMTSELGKGTAIQIFLPE